MNRVNVITAGPSAGKSSTLRELAARGYQTLPEGARIYFDQKISEGLDATEARELPDFREQLIEENRRVEEQIPVTGVVFLDRSLVDNLAFMRENDEHISDELWTECQEQGYDTVFLLERLPMAEDEVRTESDEEAARIHEELRSVYMELGYDVIDVPLMTVKDRADYIEDYIEYVPPIH